MSKTNPIISVGTSLRNHAAFTAQIALNSAIGYLFLKMLALRFGTSSAKDGFDIAYSVPFIVMSVSGFTFTHGVVTTHFSRMLARRSLQIQAVFSASLTWLLLIGSAVTFLCAVFADQLTSVLAPGLPPEMRLQTTHLLRLMLPLVFTLGIGVYLSAVLTAYAVPITSEFNPLLTRVGVILWILILAQEPSLDQIAVALVVLSGAVLLIQIRLIRKRTRLNFTPRFRAGSREFVSAGVQSLGFVVAAVMAQVSMSYMRRLATIDGEGTTAALTYAFSVVTPISMLAGKPVALVVGPRLVTAIEGGQRLAGRRQLMRAMGACVLLGGVLSGALYLGSGWLVELLYLGGKFDRASVQLTASLVAAITWSIPSALLLWVVLMPLISCGGHFGGATVYSLGYLLHLGLTAALFPTFGRLGLAYAYTLSITAQSVLAGLLVIRGTRDTAAMPDGDTLVHIAQ